MESAQLRMERMLPELRDLEQKKTFTKAEISAIVTQRNYHEASIARPKSPEPYLKYIEYEKKLERLRRLRVGKSASVKPRITISDYSIPLHILNLYSSAVKRFPDSLDLWLSYIAYALTQSSSKLISRVLSAAIAAQPSHSQFWVMAAQFEADGDEAGKGGGNVDGARKLLMRGLRFFRGASSLPLWVEWIRIELSFMQAMEKRRKVLGLEPSQKKSALTMTPEGMDAESALQTTMDLDQLPEESEQPPTALSQEISSTELKGQNALLSGALVKVVLSNSFQAVPDLGIFNAILPLIHVFDSPTRASLLDFLYIQLSENHPGNPAALIMLNTRQLFRYSSKGKIFAQSGERLVDLLATTIQKLQQLCKERPDSRLMWEEFLRFLIDVYSKLDTSELRDYVSAVVGKTVTMAMKKHADGPDLHQLAINHFRTSGPISRPLQLASTATHRFPDCLSLSVTRLGLLLNSLDSGSADPSCLKIFQGSLERFPGSLQVAQVYVRFLKKQWEHKALSDQELWLAIEAELDKVLKNPIASTDEPDHTGSCPPLTVPEIYQRALAECPMTMSRIEFYRYLSRKSVLSLNFLSWLLHKSPNEQDIGSLEHLHSLTCGHPDTGVAHWVARLKFLLVAKKDYQAADRLLAMSKSLLGRPGCAQLEKTWMDINGTISTAT